MQILLFFDTEIQFYEKTMKSVQNNTNVFLVRDILLSKVVTSLKYASLLWATSCKTLKTSSTNMLKI